MYHMREQDESLVINHFLIVKEDIYLMHHELLLQHIVEQLQPVRGLKAIVLGGSYASGSQRPDSDLDIGLYYQDEQALDITHLRSLAVRLNATSDPVVTELGGWGYWVNGGAWLTIEGQRIDFLYRNIDFVSSILDECTAGHIRSDFWQQPAYGFHNFMYCTESAICKPLYDPDQIIEQLKARVATYSPRLQRAIIDHFLWQARFTIENTYKPAARGEIYLVTGALARIIHCLIQVLYAINQTYYLSEKKLALDLATFHIRPDHFLVRINTLLGATGHTAAQLQASLTAAEALYKELAQLAQPT